MKIKQSHVNKNRKVITTPETMSVKNGESQAAITQCFLRKL